MSRDIDIDFHQVGGKTVALVGWFRTLVQSAWCTYLLMLNNITSTQQLFEFSCDIPVSVPVWSRWCIYKDKNDIIPMGQCIWISWLPATLVYCVGSIIIRPIQFFWQHSITTSLFATYLCIADPCAFMVYFRDIFVSKVNIWNVNCAIRATIETPISYPMFCNTGSCGIGIFVYNVNIWNAKIIDFQLINGCSWKNVEVCLRERNASTQRKLQPPSFGLCRMLYHLSYRKQTFTTVFHVLEHWLRWCLFLFVKLTFEMPTAYMQHLFSTHKRVF